MNDAVLLHEVNHRVANAFQAAISWLHATARSASQVDAASALREAAAQLQAFGLVHRMLCDTSIADRLDCKTYLFRLCDALDEALLAPRRIALKRNIETFEVSSDIILNLGCLVSELIGNAAKHAFPDGQCGTVELHVYRNGDGLQCCIRDDGLGRRNAEFLDHGLGMTLVQLMAQRAGARCSWAFLAGGTEATLVFDFPARRGTLVQ